MQGTQVKICPICNHKFNCYTERRNRARETGKRAYNATTCSRKCSRVWARRYKQLGREMQKETIVDYSRGHKDGWEASNIVRPCFEFERIQNKANVVEAGNYRGVV